MIEILITVNNFIHDFASALFFGGVLLLFILAREVEKNQTAETLALYRSIYRKFSPLILISFILIIVLGYFRYLTYDYYISESFARTTRVDLLIIKHVLLVGTGILGLYLYFRLRKKFDREKQ